MNRIKELREERNLTQQELATQIDTSQTNIGRWEKETNEPSASMVVRLADFFSCSIDYLLGREDDFGNIISVHKNSSLSLEEETMVTLFAKLEPYEKETILKQIKALAGEKK